VKPFVSFDEKLVTSHRPDGTTEEVTWDELSTVEIVTTDTGPFVCDVFFELHGNDRGCVVPQEVEGCKELLERLQKLPGFKNQAVIDAMCCTSNARFTAWQKENASASSAG
jgi:YD repeat-containing protein